MRTILVGVLMLALARPSLGGDSQGSTLAGALIGGAVGAVVANNSKDVDSEWGIPAGALIGGLLAHGMGKGWFNRNSGSDDGYPYYDRYGNRYDPYYGDYQFQRGGQTQYRYSAPYRYSEPYRYRETPPRQASAQAPAVRDTDLQPGVSIVKIPIRLDNGMTVDVRLLRLGDRFVGPRGETYDVLPTPEDLQAEYQAPRN